MRKSIKVIKARNLKRRTKRKFLRKTMRKGGSHKSQSKHQTSRSQRRPDAPYPSPPPPPPRTSTRQPPPPSTQPPLNSNFLKEIERGGGGGLGSIQAPNEDWEKEASNEDWEKEAEAPNEDWEEEAEAPNEDWEEEAEAPNEEWEEEAEAWNKDHPESDDPSKEEPFDLCREFPPNPVLKHERTSSIQLFKEILTIETNKNLLLALLTTVFMKRKTFGKEVDEVTYRITTNRKNIYFTIKHNKREILHISLHKKGKKYTGKKYLIGAFHIQKGQQTQGKPLIQRILIYEENGTIQLSLYQQRPGEVYEPKIQAEAELLLKILGTYYQLTGRKVVVL